WGPNIKFKRLDDWLKKHNLRLVSRTGETSASPVLLSSEEIEKDESLAQGGVLSKEATKKLCANATKKQRIRHKKNLLKIKNKTGDLPRHSRDNVVPTTIPVIKQRDIKEDCAKTLASTENKLAEGINTFFIEEKSVKDRSPPKQGVKRVNPLSTDGT
ncbi:hypothetical protein AVEN_63611-1, partial [Araneus ventricosus]